MDKKLLLAWLKAGHVETGKLFASTAGTPQGGVISPILANLALNGLEAMLREHFPRKSRLQQQAKINFVRYADDFVITGSSQTTLQDEVLPKVAAFLSERGLQLALEKTHITHIETGFDFLGFNFRKYAGKLRITPSKASQQSIIQKLRLIIRASRGASAVELIQKLNPLIRGWTNYHKHLCSSRAFNHIDQVLFQMLRRWTRRRHPKQSYAWLRKTYFTHPHKHGWRFCGHGRRTEGEIYIIELLHAREVPIRRHIQVKNAANPYAPEWESYYELRKQRRIRNQWMGKWRERELYTRQAGVCLHCQQALDEVDDWEVHHIIWQVFGGSDEIGNLQLLHANCHRQLHHRGADP
jgi:RNA-directed DNA polymerase